MFGGMTPPMIQNSMNGGGIIVRHREYIADIISSTAFQNRNLPINPGLTSTFPWLAQIANAFEQYRFRGLIFEFKSLSADSLISTSTNIGQGTVIMATQYNSLSPGFSTKIEMENYEFANSAKPSISFMHPVECAMYQTPNTPLYVRNGAIPPGSDERLYDLGNFNLATQGLPSNDGSIGELWCTFEIEFFKPKYNPNTAEGLGMDYFQTADQDAGGNAGFANISGIIPFGDLSIGEYAGNLGCRLRYTNGGNTLNIDFPPATTETNEIFLISTYLNVAGALVGSNIACTIAASGFDFIPLWFKTTPTDATSGFGSRQSQTSAASQSTQRFILICVKRNGTVLPGGNPYATVSIGDWQTVITAATTGIHNLLITRLPTEPTFNPLHLSNLTEFGTDV